MDLGKFDDADSARLPGKVPLRRAADSLGEPIPALVPANGSADEAAT